MRGPGVLSFAAMPAIERILFFGTPGFAVPTLAALVESGRRPVAVVTQPARPVGRGPSLRAIAVAPAPPPAALPGRTGPPVR